jgi:hypothetical protein
MSSTSPNFKFVLASSSDIVAVDSHIANNFSTVDSLFGALHTGTGQFKTNIAMTAPTITNPIIVGTLSGAGVVMASTGNFSTITATGGALTVNSFSLGTYGYPVAIGSTSQVLTVVTGNAQWAAAAPNTGANQGLSNLTSVAINTNMNTFTGGFVTVDRLIATSGALTGLTVFQATTGTFVGNVTITGTMTAAAVNCTGGSITAGGITIGTYALPSTIGSVNQVMQVSGGTVSFGAPLLAQTTTYFKATCTSPAYSGGSSIIFDSKVFDTGSVYNSANGIFTCSKNGFYHLGAYVTIGASFFATAPERVLSISVGDASVNYVKIINNTMNTASVALCLALMTQLTTGATLVVVVSTTAGNVQSGAFWGYKIPDV